MKLEESPDLQWFRYIQTKCRQCGKPGVGHIMGIRNEDYGLHCQKCADKRIALSKKVRERLSTQEVHDDH